MKRFLTRLLWFLVAVLVVIQFVPFRQARTNPPVRRGPDWDAPRTEELARRACFDCHSNETRWPWYSALAPMRWRIVEHVEEGRAHLNFSEFDEPQPDAHEAAELTAEGVMPLGDYLRMHPEAQLTEGERSELVNGLARTLGEHGTGEHGEH